MGMKENIFYQNRVASAKTCHNSKQSRPARTLVLNAENLVTMPAIAKAPRGKRTHPKPVGPPGILATIAEKLVIMLVTVRHLHRGRTLVVIRTVKIRVFVAESTICQDSKP